MNILGYKVGMDRIVVDKKFIPVTLIYVPKNTVSQIKTSVSKDNYDALQVCVDTIRKKNFTKAQATHFTKNNIKPGVSREFRCLSGDYKIGSILDANYFSVGSRVDISGLSKGKGFQGVIRRHGFTLQPRSHGNGQAYRTHGSTGQRSIPGRVFPGKKMAGHLGHKMKTVQDLQVVAIKNDLLIVKGCVPGPQYNLLKIRATCKR